MNNFQKSVVAGASISLGAFAYLTVLQKTNNIFLASSVFYLGLCLVFLTNSNLFTGRVYTTIYEDNYFKNLFVTFVGNLIGSVITTCLLNEIFNPYVVEIVNKKINQSDFTIIISAIFCNLFVCMAVRQFRNTKSHLIPWFLITLFVLFGFNHVVADMSYFTIGLLNGLKINIWSLIGYFFLCTSGNMLGGVLVSYLDKD